MSIFCRCIFRCVFLGLFILTIICCSKREQKFIIGEVGTIPNTFDPFQPSLKGSIYIIACMYDSLFVDQLDEQLIPKIAESYTPGLEGIIVNLRQDVHFQDGSILSASDVVNTFEYARNNNENVMFSTLVSDVKSIHSLDDFKIDVRFTQKNATDLSSLTRCPIVKFKKEHSSQKTVPVGCGQYIFDSVVDKQVRLRKNENYYLPHSGPEYLIFRFYETTQDLLKSLIINEIDFCGSPWLSPEDIQLVEKANQYNVKEFVFPYCYVFLFNQQKGKFANPKIRQAISYISDRHELVKKGLNNQGIIAKSPFHPIEEKINLFPKLYEFSEKECLRLFEESGWTKDEKGRLCNEIGIEFHFTLLCEENNSLVEIPALLLRDQLNDVGINMEIEWASTEEIYERLQQGNFDATFTPLSAEPSPDRLYSFWHSSSIDSKEGMNYWHYSNKQVDRYLEELRSEFDIEARYPIYSKILRTFAEDPPCVILFYQYRYLLSSKRFEISLPQPYALYELVYQWKISEN